MMCSSSSWSWYTFPADGNVGQKTDNHPECWIINFDTWYDPLEISRVLSQEEKFRAERFSTETLVRCFSVAHWGLRILLARWMSCKPHTISLHTGRWGKPYVPGGPFFNLSHTGSVAIVAPSSFGEVGVDVEDVRPFPGRKDVAKQFFSSRECRWIGDGENSVRRFFRCWVLREAFVKATGMGLVLPLESFGLDLPLTSENVSIQTVDGRSFSVRMLEWEPSSDTAAAIVELGV